MKRTRLRKGSSRKKESRLIIVQAEVIQSKHEGKVYHFLHEAGHDIGKFDEKMHAYLHGVEERLEHAGHTTEQAWHILSSKNNYAVFSIMPGHNRNYRIVSMQSAEKIIHKLYPDAVITWGLEKGVTDPADNKSFMQDFRVNNVSLADIVTIDATLMQYGGGIK